MLLSLSSSVSAFLRALFGRHCIFILATLPILSNCVIFLRYQLLSPNSTFFMLSRLWYNRVWLSFAALLVWEYFRRFLFYCRCAPSPIARACPKILCSCLFMLLPYICPTISALSISLLLPHCTYFVFFGNHFYVAALPFPRHFPLFLRLHPKYISPHACGAKLFICCRDSRVNTFCTDRPSIISIKIYFG